MRVPPRWGRPADHPEQEQDSAVERERGELVGEEVVAGLPRGVDVRHPVRGATEGVEQGRRQGGHRRRLDVVEERWAVLPQEQQWDQPPPPYRGARRPATTCFRERRRGPGSRVSSQDDAQRDHGEGGCALTPPTAATARADSERSPTGRAPLRAEDEGDQHPRRECAVARPRSRSARSRSGSAETGREAKPAMIRLGR